MSKFKSVKTLKNWLKQRKIVHAMLLDTLPFKYKLKGNHLYCKGEGYNRWVPSTYDIDYLFSVGVYK